MRIGLIVFLFLPICSSCIQGKSKDGFVTTVVPSSHNTATVTKEEFGVIPTFDSLTSTLTQTDIPTRTTTPTITAQPTQTPEIVRIKTEKLGIPADYNSNTYHWQIHDLQNWHDRIYVAHGDWIRNTGPVKAIYFDIELNKFVHDNYFYFDEEAIEKFQLIDDVLLVPGMDPTDNWEFGNFYYKEWGHTWKKNRTVRGAIHMMDVVRLDNQFIVLSTDGDDQGNIWISDDGGSSWINHPQGLEIFGHNSTKDPRNVRASLFVFMGEIYLTTLSNGCFVFREQEWVDSNCISKSENTYKTVSFDGSVIMIPFQSNRNRLILFDDKGPYTLDFNGKVLDAVSTTSGLFILVRENSKGMVYYASNLNCRCIDDYRRVGFLDVDAIDIRSDPSLDFAQNRLFLGSYRGFLYMSEELDLSSLSD